MGCLRQDPRASGGTCFCMSCLAKIGRAEARPSAMNSSGILRGRDSLRYFDGQLKGGGSVRTGDFRFTAGKRASDDGCEGLRYGLLLFYRIRGAADLPVDPALDLP